MKNFRIHGFAYILFFILLSGCGDSNPYIGKWESSSHGPIQALSFTKNEMISLVKGAEKKEMVKYKKEGSNWLISFDDGKTYESSFEFKDKNTMTLKGKEVKLTFKRVQSLFDVVIDVIFVILGLILWVIRGIIDIVMSLFRMLMQ